MTTTTKELCSYKEIKELSNNVVRRIYLNDKVYEPSSFNLPFWVG